MGSPFLRKAAVPIVVPLRPPAPSTVGTASAGIAIESRKPAPPGGPPCTDKHYKNVLGPKGFHAGHAPNLLMKTRNNSASAEEIAMNGKNAFIALALTTALSILGAASAAAGMKHGDRGGERGAVLPCSLDGVNPAYHPEIFGNPAAARSYGFVRSPGGTWQVAPGCRQR